MRKKIFVSHRFTGENKKTLSANLTVLCDLLHAAGLQYYCSWFDCSFFDAQHYTYQQRLEHTLQRLASSDILFGFITSQSLSTGMLIEIGYALAHRKKIVLAIKKGISLCEISPLADQILEYNVIQDLQSGIQQLR